MLKSIQNFLKDVAYKHASFENEASVIFDLGSVDSCSTISNPQNLTYLSKQLQINYGGNTPPQVSVSVQGKSSNRSLNLTIHQAGSQDSWWGLRMTPAVESSSIGLEIFVLSFDIKMTSSKVAPGFVAKIVDNHHDTLEFADHRTNMELIHVAHFHADNIFCDINIGEGLDAVGLTEGTVTISNMKLIKTEFCKPIIKQLSHFNKKNSQAGEIHQLEVGLFELLLAYFFDNKFSGYWHYNPEKALLPYLIDKNDVVFDVGGNWGIYSVALADYAKTVFYFEPNPDVVPFAQLLLRKYHNIIMLQLGLGLKPESLPFYVNKNIRDSLLDSGCGTFGNQCTDKNAKDFVARDLCILPGDMFKDFAPRFIKIDVEGQELNVLKGCHQILIDYQPKLYVEIDPTWNKDALEVFNYLAELHYSCFYFSKKLKKFIQVTDNIAKNEFAFIQDSNTNFVFINKYQTDIIAKIENCFS